MFHNGTVSSSHFDGPNLGQPDDDLGVVGPQGAEVHLKGGRVGIDRGGNPQYLLVVGRGDPD